MGYKLVFPGIRLNQLNSTNFYFHSLNENKGWYFRLPFSILVVTIFLLFSLNNIAFANSLDRLIETAVKSSLTGSEPPEAVRIAQKALRFIATGNGSDFESLERDIGSAFGQNAGSLYNTYVKPIVNRAMGTGAWRSYLGEQPPQHLTLYDLTVKELNTCVAKYEINEAINIYYTLDQLYKSGADSTIGFPVPAEHLLRIGTFCFNIRDYNQAIKVFNMLAERHGNKHSPSLGSTYNNIAELYLMRIRKEIR